MIRMSEYVKDSYNSIAKNSNNPIKCANDFNRHFSKKIFLRPMASRYMKRCSVSLTIRKCKSKP